MLKKKNIYKLFIGLTLLLFTQVVIPYLHNHAERKYAQGINEEHADKCIVCSLDIVAADFILPAVFSICFISLVHSYREKNETAQLIVFSIARKGRAPPYAIFS